MVALFWLSLILFCLCVSSFRHVTQSLRNFGTSKSIKRPLKYGVMTKPLHAASGAAPANTISVKTAKLNRLVNRVTWISWWSQITLSIVSGVILTFANTVRTASSTNVQSVWASGFAFSSFGVALALMNALSTWNITRVCRRVKRGRVVGANVGKAFRKYFRLSVSLSFLGMLVTLVGAEQIVGSLASKVLSSQGLQAVLGGVNPQNALQAVDIFLVQANTNCLVAHFAPLLSYIWLGDQLPDETN